LNYVWFQELLGLGFAIPQEVSLDVLVLFGDALPQLELEFLDFLANCLLLKTQYRLFSYNTMLLLN